MPVLNSADMYQRCKSQCDCSGHPMILEFGVGIAVRGKTMNGKNNSNKEITTRILGCRNRKDRCVGGTKNMIKLFLRKIHSARKSSKEALKKGGCEIS